MSLTDLLTHPASREEARRLLDPYLPDYTRTVAKRARVKASSGHPQLVGVAFDYALRLELAYLAALRPTHWVAEAALGRLSRSKLSERAEDVVRDARAAERAGWSSSLNVRHAQIAGHAAKLAQLDQVIRAAYPPTFGEADGIAEAAIAGEVVALMAIAKPAWDLATSSPLVLNPTFGDKSLLVGGADADLIAGGSLIEIKTRQEACIERDDMRQLLGYAVLAGADQTDLPSLTSVAVYFSRFGVLQQILLPRRLDARTCRSVASRLGELWRRRVAA